MLRCNDISVSYGSVKALSEVSLHVEANEIISLLGANGAGKTTLLRAISGLTATSGTVSLDGSSIDHLSPSRRVRAGVAQAPERRRIFPGLTVLENLTVATAAWKRLGVAYDEDLDRVYQLFPRLKERARQLGWSLSGGEQQMLAIGRALMSRPRVLLLDEPSLGLAPMLSEEVYERIAKINKQGMTVLLVEQNTAMALAYSTRAYVLEHGKIVLEGTAKVLAEHPRVREAYLGT
ncbi:ABC transporter ATP-binding protein [Undibacter mobilis]|uniref:ABC transporter ATP-binding protein n=1 Tax=Undibacter mobilis TaxID=2292256 RepID=A0A371B396_9BRAD|nr:ABC transporter ATP-binding protein [Undibacter mobilis]RDV02002.1 ABC transporter ATP-binding protein [Undibacter mobilis]